MICSANGEQSYQMYHACHSYQLMNLHLWSSVPPSGTTTCIPHTKKNMFSGNLAIAFETRQDFWYHRDRFFFSHWLLSWKGRRITQRKNFIIIKWSESLRHLIWHGPLGRHMSVTSDVLWNALFSAHNQEIRSCCNEGTPFFQFAGWLQQTKPLSVLMCMGLWVSEEEKKKLSLV